MWTKYIFPQGNKYFHKFCMSTLPLYVDNNYIFPQGNKYFHKLWSEILKNDAHDGEWIKYPKSEHPKFIKYHI